MDDPLDVSSNDRSHCVASPTLWVYTFGVWAADELAELVKMSSLMLGIGRRVNGNKTSKDNGLVKSFLLSNHGLAIRIWGFKMKSYSVQFCSTFLKLLILKSHHVSK